MPATLTDVAKRAGVSLATASRAFSEPGRLAAATRQKVTAAAEELGYEAPGQSGPRTIGVVVPDVANAVFAALIKAIQERAWPGRHRMLLADTAESTDREREQVAALAAVADGVVLCSPRLPADELRGLAGSVPAVVVNGEAERAPSVLLDAGDGLRQAVEHLFALGHRKLAYVPGPPTSWADAQRLEAVTRLCEEWEIELASVGHQNATVDGGLAAAASVVASGATAAIAYNDLVAIGLLAGARQLGRHCPEDLSVVGIDDLDVAAAAEPGLTSVRIPIERGGALALDLLLEQLAGKPRPAGPVRLGSQLIVRGSTSAPRSSPVPSKKK